MNPVEADAVALLVLQSVAGLVVEHLLASPDPALVVNLPIDYATILRCPEHVHEYHHVQALALFIVPWQRVEPPYEAVTLVVLHRGGYPLAVNHDHLPLWTFHADGQLLVWSAVGLEELLGRKVIPAARFMVALSAGVVGGVNGVALIVNILLEASTTLPTSGAPERLVPLVPIGKVVLVFGVVRHGRG